METKPVNPLLIAAWKRLQAALRFMNRLRMKAAGNSRPGSYPYPCGDSFRALADHVHEEGRDLDPSLVKAGDIVFVSNSRTLQYLKDVHPRTAHPYVLVSHNGDLDIGKECADLLDGRIVRLYAQDNVYEHAKIVPIPIGVENLWMYTNGIPWALKWRSMQAERLSPAKKRDRILYRFSVHTNAAHRGPLLERFRRHPLMETFTEMLPPILHLRKLMGYKFVASPRGNSIESCRTWEALYLRTVPIVEDFTALRYFKKIGLPLWIVRDWTELDGLAEEALAAKYHELMKAADLSALHMDFWIAMIRKDQETARTMVV